MVKGPNIGTLLAEIFYTFLHAARAIFPFMERDKENERERDKENEIERGTRERKIKRERGREHAREIKRERAIDR